MGASMTSQPNTYIFEVKSIGLSTRKDSNGKKRKPQTLEMAAQHNLREIQAENGADFGKLDPTRSHLNEVLLGPSTALEVKRMNERLFHAAGVDPLKLRKDYCQASEHVFSLPPGQDERGFFGVILKCAQKIYGADKVLSFVIHRDQDQPHAHMLVSPIAKGRYMGSKLHMAGPLKVIKSRYREATQTIGFSPPPTGAIKRQQISEQAAAVIAHLERINHPILSDPLWTPTLKAINRDPKDFFEFYSLSANKAPMTMAEHRLRKDKGPIRNIDIEPRGVDHQYLPSVGIGKQTHSNAHQAQAPETPSATPQTIRVRECEQDPSRYDPETGEFYGKPPSSQSKRAMADEWVKTTLKQTPAGRIAQ
jgi:hypothetical protein